MDIVMFVGAIALAVGVVVSTVIFRYATTRTVRLMTMIIGAVISVPLLVIAIIELIIGGTGTATATWALAICGIFFGYWFKSPFRMLQD